MKRPGYIYVKNWDRFQHYHDRAPSWIKLHLSLLGNDAWLALSGDDSKLLITIWMLTARYGNGRVLADSRWLQAQAKGVLTTSYRSSNEVLNQSHPRSNGGLSNRYRGLERLTQAGFIAIRARRGLEPVYPKRTIEGSKEPKRKNARERLAADTAAAARAEEEPPHTNGWDGAGEARAEFLRLAAEKKAMP